MGWGYICSLIAKYGAPLDKEVETPDDEYVHSYMLKSDGIINVMLRGAIEKIEIKGTLKF